MSTANFKKKYFYLFLLLHNLIIYSQENIDTYNKLIEKNFYNNPLQAKKNCFDLLNASISNKDYKNESSAYLYLAALYGNLSEKDSCLYYYEKAILNAKKNKDPKSVLIIKINEANYLLNEYDLESSFTLYEEALNIANEIDNKYMSEYIQLKKGEIYLETGRYNEAISILKKGLLNKSFDKNIVLEIYQNLAKVYLKTTAYKKSLLYSEKGYSLSVGFNSQFEIHFLNQQGMAYLKLKNYQPAEIKLKKALEKSINTSYYEMSRLIRINISKLYTIQNKNYKAIELLNYILKNKENIKIATENKYEIYYLLAENYKVLDDLNSSNRYYILFIEESKNINEKKIKNIELLLESDIDKLKTQKTNLTNQKWFLYLFISFLIVILLLFIIHKIKQVKRNTIKFNTLLEKIKILEEKKIKSKNSEATKIIEFEQYELTESKNNEQSLDKKATCDSEIKIEEDKNQIFIIKNDTIEEILDGLLKLEKRRYFLKQECTLHDVAKKLKTNTAYLSRIVNNELHKSFSAYINELRINYIILELKNNSKLRSYSIKALAKEIGYKSPESFTKYFKIATGISPAVYIKKINRM